VGAKRYAVSRRAEYLLARLVAFAEAPLPAALPSETQQLLVDVVRSGHWWALPPRELRSVVGSSPLHPEVLALHGELRVVLRGLADGYAGAGFPIVPLTVKISAVPSWPSSTELADTARSVLSQEAGAVDSNWPTQDALAAIVGLAQRRTAAGVQLLAGGAVRDLFLFQAFNLLQAAGAQRLKRCECRRLYVKTGRREYCSERCQKRVYMRGQRAAATARKRKRGRDVKATRTR
jgi:hypothetical protein